MGSSVGDGDDSSRGYAPFLPTTVASLAATGLYQPAQKACR
jgi:hypothetical protein